MSFLSDCKVLISLGIDSLCYTISPQADIYDETLANSDYGVSQLIDDVSKSEISDNFIDRSEVDKSTLTAAPKSNNRSSALIEYNKNKLKTDYIIK